MQVANGNLRLHTQRVTVKSLRALTHSRSALAAASATCLAARTSPLASQLTLPRVAPRASSTALLTSRALLRSRPEPWLPRCSPQSAVPPDSLRLRSQDRPPTSGLSSSFVLSSKRIGDQLSVERCSPCSLRSLRPQASYACVQACPWVRTDQALRASSSFLLSRGLSPARSLAVASDRTSTRSFDRPLVVCSPNESRERLERRHSSSELLAVVRRVRTVRA